MATIIITDHVDAETAQIIQAAYRETDHAGEQPIAWKYSDPTEDSRWIYTEDDLVAIEREDPSLIVRVR